MIKTKTNGIFGKKIIQAVKLGGSPSPDANHMLASVITAAKKADVPADNIKRAIERASAKGTAAPKESTFEAYAAGGVSFVINVLTDNDNRAVAEVKVREGGREGGIEGGSNRGREEEREGGREGGDFAETTLCSLLSLL